MKTKKTKKLPAFIFAGSMVALSAVTAGVTLTSCGPSSTNQRISCSEPSKTATAANKMEATWVFNLKADLADGEEITRTDSVSYSEMVHLNLPTFTITATTKNSVTVKGEFIPADNKDTGKKWETGNITFALTFAVKKGSTEVWTEKVSNLKFSFSK